MDVFSAGAMLYGGIGMGLTVTAIAWVGLSHRHAAELDERCEGAFADVDAYLKHRADLVPGLVEIVRGFVSHERYAVDAVTQALEAARQAAGWGPRIEAETVLGNSLTQLVSITERLPELRASPHFGRLREDLIAVNERITAARRFYNQTASEYNAVIRSGAVGLLGGMRMRPRRPFTLTERARAELEQAPAFDLSMA